MKLRMNIFLFFSFILLISLSSSACPSSSSSYEVLTRHYCILSKEISWNYSPNSTSSRMDLTMKYEENARNILTLSVNSMGSIFIKAIFKQFQFNLKTERCDWNNEIIDSNQEKNGFLGPTIRGIVGDTLYIHYFNNCSRTYSIYPHGLYFTQVISTLSTHFYFFLL